MLSMINANIREIYGELDKVELESGKSRRKNRGSLALRVMFNSIK